MTNYLFCFGDSNLNLHLPLAQLASQHVWQLWDLVSEKASSQVFRSWMLILSYLNRTWFFGCHYGGGKRPLNKNDVVWDLILPTLWESPVPSNQPTYFMETFQPKQMAVASGDLGYHSLLGKIHLLWHFLRSRTAIFLEFGGWCLFETDTQKKQAKPVGSVDANPRKVLQRVEVSTLALTFPLG